MPLKSLLFCALLVTAHAHAETRRALLIGINDYTASQLRAQGAKVERDEWPNLSGTVNDVRAWRELLVSLYRFRSGDIVTLTDQQASREAILAALEALTAKVEKGDVVFFYYAGHGSQVRNSRSDEKDKLDESLVPADSKVGAPDIRDKELRPLFNRMLDRGARLTVLLDACHSGSGARGLPSGARSRGVAPDLRDVADGRDYGPRPENRGAALVLAASQDFDLAWEIGDEPRKRHGLFTWAWMMALGDASASEPAEETFLRARARVYAERPYQEPVLAGSESARRAPFLGTRTDRRGGRAVVAVSKVREDGTVLLQGGWANGLAAGSTLRAGNSRLVVTAVKGLTRSEARVEAGRVHPGTLLEHLAWASPKGRRLRVWIPRAPAAMDAKAIRDAAVKRGVRWAGDPTETAITHLLRWNGEWELVTMSGKVERGGIGNVPKGASLFVQFPGRLLIADEEVDVVRRPEEADYLLAGRFANGKLQYAWIRPSATAADARKTGLPARTAWTADHKTLREHLARLRTIHGWHALQSPAVYPYRLQLPQKLTGGQEYKLTIRLAPNAQRVPQRYVYLFAIDSHGKSSLLFPVSGSVENRFPAGAPPAAIELSECRIEPPYGLDTYFLLTTSEPLPNPYILAWEGVRAARAVLKDNWSIERVVVESVPPY